MSRQESPEARAERILAELRAATSEAAGVLKDLVKAIASARGQVEEYLHAEVEQALHEYQQDMIAGTRRITSEHEAKVTQRVIDFAALIENNFSREALIREAVNRILAELQAHPETRRRQAQLDRAGIVISVCDRPHAD